jgi:hypothetical protein
MNQGEFLDLLHRFAERPVPALGERHVYLWHGDVAPLRRALPDHTLRTLDLHTLAATLSRSPSSLDGARRVLLQAIRSQIADLHSSDRQQILVVTGCDLLSRYRVPLGSFFEIASERTVVIFAIPPDETYLQFTEPLPEYVSLNPRAPFDYLRGALGERAVIATSEE